MRHLIIVCILCTLLFLTHASTSRKLERLGLDDQREEPPRKVQKTSEEQPIRPEKPVQSLKRKERILDFSKAVISEDIIPSQHAIDAAAKGGKLKILQKIYDEFKRFPSLSGANLAAENGHLDVLEWMASLKKPVYPDKWGANKAVWKGHLDVLKWMASLEEPIYPTTDGANDAAKKGHLDVLKWMADLNPPIYPTQDGADGAAWNGRLGVLKWMASLKEPIYPTQAGAKCAEFNDHVDVLEWMANLDPPITP